MVNGTTMSEGDNRLAARFQAFLKQLQMALEFGLADIGSHAEQEDVIETMLWQLHFSQRPYPAIVQRDVAGF